MQQVEERGAENLDMGSLSAQVMTNLNAKGVRSKRLVQGGAQIEAASSFSKNMSGKEFYRHNLWTVAPANFICVSV